MRRFAAFLGVIALFLFALLAFLATTVRAHGQFAGPLSAEEQAKYEARRLAARNHAYVFPFIDPAPSETRPRCLCIRVRATYDDKTGVETCYPVQDLKRDGVQLFAQIRYVRVWDELRGHIGPKLDVWMHTHGPVLGRGDPLGGAIVAQTVLAGEIAPTKRRRVVAH